jgi:hypothetical protein
MDEKEEIRRVVYTSRIQVEGPFKYDDIKLYDKLKRYDESRFSNLTYSKKEQLHIGNPGNLNDGGNKYSTSPDYYLDMSIEDGHFSDVRLFKRLKRRLPTNKV